MRRHASAGITTLDTADIYGPSETLIGNFLRSKPPADVVVCTKFCCFDGLESIGRDEVRRRILASCKRLGVPRLDLVAFFWLDFSVKNYVEVARYLTELREEGLIGEIGVTNFDALRLKELLDAGVPVVSNQVQYSILDRRPQHGLAQLCKEKGVALLTYGTLGGGLLSERFLGRPAPGRGELATPSLRMYRRTAEWFGGWELLQELLAAMHRVAVRHSVSVANVATRYVLDQDAVAAVLVGVRNSDHVQENLRAFSFHFTEEDRRELEAVLGKAKGPVGDVYSYERGYA